LKITGVLFLFVAPIFGLMCGRVGGWMANTVVSIVKADTNDPDNLTIYFPTIIIYLLFYGYPRTTNDGTADHGTKPLSKGTDCGCCEYR
jgi:hypothetical protein